MNVEWITPSMSESSSASVPRAILYTWPSSVWSTVPQLCLIEKGYSEDEYVIKHVDITKGENFAPSYLKINFNGTIPTLVVPTMETIGDEVDTRYRSLKDTAAICNFLDQSRTAGSQNTTSDKPAPALAPATIEGKATSDDIIRLVHQPTVDPNFLNMSARDAAELKKKASSTPGSMLSARRAALERHIKEAQSLSENGNPLDRKLLPFLQAKAQANQSLWEVYNGEGSDDKREEFYQVSKTIWTEQIPAALEQIETAIKGPFVLGDQVSLADLHLISWLTRLVTVSLGEPTVKGIDSLEKQFEGKKIGPQIRGFWAAWLERESFQKVLLPNYDSFVEAVGKK